MAIEGTSTVTTRTGSFAKWTTPFAALVGLWVLASPFLLSGAIGTGTAFYTTVGAGLVILVLSAFGAYTIRSAAERDLYTPGELSGWIAAVAGLWITLSPFALTGSIASGIPMYSTAAAGFVALVLAGYASYVLHTEG